MLRSMVLRTGLTRLLQTANQIAHVNCGGCGITLMCVACHQGTLNVPPLTCARAVRRYAYGAQSVKCAVCNFVTQACGVGSVSPLLQALPHAPVPPRRAAAGRRPHNQPALLGVRPNAVQPVLSPSPSHALPLTPSQPDHSRGRRWLWWRTRRRWTTKANWFVSSLRLQPCRRLTPRCAQVSNMAVGVVQGKP